jgi:hypothetical protein
MRKANFRSSFGKISGVWLVIFAVFTMGCLSTREFTGGRGTRSDPWQIATAEQLGQIRNHLDGHYILTSDISLSSYDNWEPIGIFKPMSEDPSDAENPDPAFAFSGSFNGNGHTISNVTINSSLPYGVGLFGCALGNGGETVIGNINLENVTVTGNWIVGGLIGYQFEGCLIKNVHLSGGNNTITGNNGLGGIVGGGADTIENCSAEANIVVIGNQYGGGSAGILGGGLVGCLVQNCSAQGSITATAAAGGPGCYALGGLVGSLGEGGELRDSSVSQATIATGEGAVMAGGLLGYGGDFLDEDPNAVKTQITGCSVQQVTINAPDSASRIGGLLGGSFYLEMYAALHATPSSFDVRDCTVQNSSISGGALLGSIAGYAYKSTIENCSGTVAGADNQTGRAEDTFAGF